LRYFNPRIKNGLTIRWPMMEASVKAIGLQSIAIGNHAFVK